MLTFTHTICVQLHSLEWHQTEDRLLYGQYCRVCDEPLAGQPRWARVWGSLNGSRPKFMRLCEACGMRAEGREISKVPRDLVLMALREALNAVQLRVAFIGHPREPMFKGQPDWSKEIALIDQALTLTKGEG